MKKTLNPLHANTLKTLKLNAFNPMQLSAIEKGKSGKNLMLLSPTGSGKTLAFLSIVLEKLEKLEEGVNALVLIPSRELAQQVESVFRSLKSSLKVTCCYGGHSFKIEGQSLSEAPAVLIGTPGRILDHISRKTIDLSNVGLVVMDEYDKLLQLGFLDELDEVFRVFKNKPQVILTSATTIDKSPSFIRSKNFETIDFRNSDTSNLKMYSLRTNSEEKVQSLIKLLKHFKQEPTLIFCNHREAVDRISTLFSEDGIIHCIFHGLLEQIDREKNLIKFRSGATNILLATDLAARGLDIPLIKHVIHFQLPPNNDEFMHRNGRTARMHAEGEAYVIVTEDEPLPRYITNKVEEFKLQRGATTLPLPKFTSIYISAGKKDKISKADVLGFLTQACRLKGSDIGLISILDKASYVAVQRSKVGGFIKDLQDPRIKKLRVKVEIAS